MNTLQMCPSRVLAKLRAGKVATCFKLNLADARAMEIAAMAGFDCLWPDIEHVPNDLAVIEKGIWAAKSQDVDVMVRVARGGYSDYIRPLEIGRRRHNGAARDEPGRCAGRGAHDAVSSDWPPSCGWRQCRWRLLRD